MKILTFVLVLFPLLSQANNFPPEWWIEIPRTQAQSWEILPQDARHGEVILSKRTELGVFSNFSATPITIEDKKFASIEGLWQSLKYPDPTLPHDPRFEITEWPFTRDEVQMLVGTEAKNAGNLANEIYKKYQLKNVSWGNHFFDYVDHAEGSAYHYDLIKKALKTKLNQNSGLWELLIRTDCLILKSDHIAGPNEPDSFRYFDILMVLRSERQFVPCHGSFTSFKKRVFENNF